MYLDRYPAKMVGRLATSLLNRFGQGCGHLLDPFCGSASVLSVAAQRGIRVTGCDVNPYATLLARVKLEGFDRFDAFDILDTVLGRARRSRRLFSIEWDAKDYWFTASTIYKYECLRYQLRGIPESRERRALLLALALSARRCSRADQKSPKPFISKRALKQRKGRHFDPFIEISTLVASLSDWYGRRTHYRTSIREVDVSSTLITRQPRFSHVITSPPYINAQDYFRNSKLELNLLRGLLPFDIQRVQTRMIGTERELRREHISASQLRSNTELWSTIRKIRSRAPVAARVIDRYMCDMRYAVRVITASLLPKGTLVMVCGDNLVGGHRVPTWRLVNNLLREQGLELFDQYGDTIENRMLPPKRHGHHGLIKQEVVSAFSKN